MMFSLHNQRGAISFFVIVGLLALSGLGIHETAKSLNAKQFQKAETIFWNVVENVQQHKADYGIYPSTIEQLPNLYRKENQKKLKKIASMRYFESFGYSALNSGQSCLIEVRYHNGTWMRWTPDKFSSNKQTVGCDSLPHK